MFDDVYKGSVEVNGTCGAPRVLWIYSWCSAGVFIEGSGISMPDGDGGEDRLCIWIEMQKKMIVLMLALI